MVRSRDFTTSDPMGGRGFGPSKSPGMGRGLNSVKLKNPAPAPERGGFDGGMLVQPDASKIRSMKKTEFAKRESGRGKSTI